MTKAAEDRLRELLRTFGPAETGPAIGPRSGCSQSAVLLKEQRDDGCTYYHRNEMSTNVVAELVVTLLNTAHDMLQELAHLRAPHRAGTLPWAVASGRPFRRPCWTNLEAVAEKGPDSQLRAYPPGRPEFWWYLTPSVHDATATDYVLL